MRTEKHFLCKSKTEKKDKFKRGGIDRFVLEMEDVGERINKVQIGHDNYGFGAGLFACSNSQNFLHFVMMNFLLKVGT